MINRKFRVADSRKQPLAVPYQSKEEDVLVGSKTGLMIETAWCSGTGFLGGIGDFIIRFRDMRICMLCRAQLLDELQEAKEE